MQLSDYAFDHLPFSQLFKTYVCEFEKLADFFATNPFDENAIKRKVEDISFSGDRDKTANMLKDLNTCFGADELAFSNIDRLAKDDALAIVTGQQLGLYGGPLYTVFKTISTIHLAAQLQQKYDRTVVPVFWLADEDHDYEEVRSVTVLDNDEPVSFSLPPKENHLPAVAEITLSHKVKDIRADLKDVLYDTDFSEELWAILDDAFSPGNTFFEAFGFLMSRLFSSHGLVLAGSNHPKVKGATRRFLKQSVVNADEIRSNLEYQSEQIGQEYHQQVTLYDSNLFYLDEEYGRTKINRNGSGWKTDEGIEWNSEELINEIDHYPERFSPNVFLRPILQDALLPTLGYVAGPGEIAYYGQMKKMYHNFDLTMPIIFPRLSATLIEPAINRIMGELPFKFHEYNDRIEDLESAYVDRTEQHDIEEIFSDWLGKFEKLTDTKTKTIAEIDPTLEAAAEKASAIYENELNKLKGKVYRSVKKQDQIQLQRIRRIKANLFPNRGLQERTIASIYYMNKYGLDIWDKLLNALEKDEDFDHHKLIYL